MTATTIITDPLTDEERDQLMHLESTIAQTIRAFEVCGSALQIIHSKGLYRETHGSFESYCDERWGLTSRRARQLMAASELFSLVYADLERRALLHGRTVESVAKDAPAQPSLFGEVKAPETEKQMRELGRSEDPAGLWLEAQAEHDTPQPSSRQIHETRVRLSEDDRRQDVNPGSPPVPERSYDKDCYSTPGELVDLGRYILGGVIDLDPATHPAAQERYVHAREFYTREDDGLAQHWHGRIWCNPPYSGPAPWGKMMREGWQADQIEAACMLVPTDHSTQWYKELALTAPMTLQITRRISFWHPDNDAPDWGARGCHTMFVFGSGEVLERAEIVARQEGWLPMVCMKGPNDLEWVVPRGLV